MCPGKNDTGGFKSGVQSRSSNAGCPGLELGYLRFCRDKGDRGSCCRAPYAKASHLPLHLSFRIFDTSAEWASSNKAESVREVACSPPGQAECTNSQARQSAASTIMRCRSYRNDTRSLGICSVCVDGDLNEKGKDKAGKLMICFVRHPGR
jgi:hypothetical protein